MEVKAELISVSKDWQNGGFQIAFHIESLNSQEDLSGKLRLSVRPWREKRSLTANSYYWILLTALSESLDTTKEELHEEMLRRYSKPLEDEDGLIVATLPNRININKIAGHWKRWKGNATHTAYIMLKGSSEMDSKEFSYLVDRVIEECQEQGIQTMTPDEVARLDGYERLGAS